MLRHLPALALVFGCSSSALSQTNPIISTSRLLLEWDVTPNVQWAPNTIDPEADPDRTLNVLKPQPVFPFRLKEDWSVLIRTVFRFVSAPSASPDLGLTLLGEPLVTEWNQSNRTSFSDFSPTVFFVPNLGSEWTIGFGPSMVISAGDCPTDSGKLSVGPAAFAYYHSGPWTLGGRLANQPTQISLEGFYNAVKPMVGGEELLGDWSIRTKVQVLFP